MIIKQCPACRRHTFEWILEDVWECANLKCGFNSNCFGCKTGECQQQARERRK